MKIILKCRNYKEAYPEALPKLELITKARKYNSIYLIKNFNLQYCCRSVNIYSTINYIKDIMEKRECECEYLN